jgi:hypothetical protein
MDPHRTGRPWRPTRRTVTPSAWASKPWDGPLAWWYGHAAPRRSRTSFTFNIFELWLTLINFDSCCWKLLLYVIVDCTPFCIGHRAYWLAPHAGIVKLDTVLTWHYRRPFTSWGSLWLQNAGTTFKTPARLCQGATTLGDLSKSNSFGHIWTNSWNDSIKNWVSWAPAALSHPCTAGVQEVRVSRPGKACSPIMQPFPQSKA